MSAVIVSRRKFSIVDGSVVLKPAGNTAKSLWKSSTKAASRKERLDEAAAEQEALALSMVGNLPCIDEEVDVDAESYVDATACEENMCTRKMQALSLQKDRKSTCLQVVKDVESLSSPDEKAQGEGFAQGESDLVLRALGCGNQQASDASQGENTLATLVLHKAKAIRSLGQPKVKMNRITEQRQQLITRSRLKHEIGSSKIGKIAPEELSVPSAPQNLMKRCGWITSQSGPAHVVYHDEEWGVPVHDDRKLFEMLVLVAAQAEVSWSIVFEKREEYRNLLAGFDPTVVARFDEKKIQSLKSSSSIMQHEGKLRGIVQNAVQILKIKEEFGSFDKYLWGFVGNKTIVNKFCLPMRVPVKTPKSESLSKALLKRGFWFVGPTIMYSFMQATGMVNDHLVTCFRYHQCNSQQVTQTH